MRPALQSDPNAVRPTPGPWAVYDVNPVIVLADRYSVGGFAVATCYPVRKVTQEQAEANARLIAEAGTVHHETGLSPQQIRDQRDRLARHALNNSRHETNCRYYGGHDCDCGLDELRAECRQMLGPQ